MSFREFLTQTDESSTNLNFPKIDEWGLDGTYNMSFLGSPLTSNKFVSYLLSIHAKDIRTGKRGQEYLITWNHPPLDDKKWKNFNNPT